MGIMMIHYDIIVIWQRKVVGGKIRKLLFLRVRSRRLVREGMTLTLS